MRMIAIHAQTERKRLDRSVRCAEKRRPWARKQRLRGLIRPDPAVCATAGAACGRKSLSSARIQAIFTSNDTPLGECRLIEMTEDKALNLNFISGAYADMWLDIDSCFELSSMHSKVILDFYLPDSNVLSPQKLIVLTNGIAVKYLKLERSVVAELTIDRHEGGPNSWRILCENPEVSTEGDVRRLGVKLVSARGLDPSGNLVNLEFATDRATESDANVLLPNYWRVAAEFDREYYSWQLGDQPMHHDPILHYLAFGWRSNVAPNADFDPVHYTDQLAVAAIEFDVPPFSDYLSRGRLIGLTPKKREGFSSKSDLDGPRPTDGDIWIDRVRELLAALGIHGAIPENVVFSKYIIWLFDAEFYRENHGLSADMTFVELFSRYLVFDFPRGEAPGPLFDEQHYTSSLREHGISANLKEPAFRHWMRVGVPLQISPTPLFDAKEYLALNLDLASYPNWVFEHWVAHGLSEGRLFDRNLRIARNRKWTESKSLSTIDSFVRHAARLQGVAGDILKIRGFRNSQKFAHLIEQAALIDPNIPHVHDHVLSLIAPIHDEDFSVYKDVLSLMPSDNIDSIVVMPFCKMGGSDFVAGILSKAIDRAKSRVLVLRTDASDWERPDWFSDNVLTVDISGALKAHPQYVRERILYEIILFLRPRTVFNVNSRLAFDTFVRFGERLALSTNIFCYYFCADRNEHGRDAGYPVWYFANILPYLKGALTDSHFLADGLKERHALDDSQSEKLHVLYTPVTKVAPQTAIVEQQIESESLRPRPRMLWAGRLDRQKRFDLVVEVASLMPDVDFDCWGKAVLDHPPQTDFLPKNLRLFPPFNDYSELPLSDSDGWLYTADWDGIPTILIELANMGVPIVASAVGGIAELLTNETGWPVAAQSLASDYVARIREMLHSADARREKASALRRKVNNQHSSQQYFNAIMGLIHSEGTS